MTARGPRWEAQQAWLCGTPQMTYIPLKPCKRCGTSERRTDNGNCCECERGIQRVRSRDRYHADPERGKAEVVAYRKANRAKVNERLARKHRERFKSDLQLPLRHSIHKLTNRLIHKGNRRISIVGCTGLEFRQWLEDQFTSDMTWANYGTVWHIDHIKPLTSFDLTKSAEYLAGCHYTNTRPLFGAENIARGEVTRKAQRASRTPK